MYIINKDSGIRYKVSKKKKEDLKRRYDEAVFDYEGNLILDSAHFVVELGYLLEMPKEYFSILVLNEAVLKWKAISLGKKTDKGTEDCALCLAYNHCVDCPVSKDTNVKYCAETPYQEWQSHQASAHNKSTAPYGIECDECMEIAEREADYLCSLFSIIKGG